MADQSQIARVRTVLPKAIHQWIFDKNVTMIGVGWPERGGVYDQSEAALCFHVRQKYESGSQLESAVRQGSTGGTIPEEIDGVRTDVLQSIPRLHQFWGGWRSGASSANPRGRVVQPIQGGVSIGCERLYGSGTLGGLVVDRQTKRLMCLSNWHVLVARWSNSPPQRIYQPGRLDGGAASNTFAILDRDAMIDNLDAAVARLYGDRPLINNQLDIGPVRGLARPGLGMEVVKSGYKTNVTEGIITRTFLTVKMRYDGQERLIRSVFYIDPLPGSSTVSDAGDSGSMWLEADTHYAVGLHFAGGNYPEHALAMDINEVLDALQVDLVAG